MYTYGDQYVGDWVDAKKHGEGELLYANGDRFRGQWDDDRSGCMDKQVKGMCGDGRSWVGVADNG